MQTLTINSQDSIERLFYSKSFQKNNEYQYQKPILLGGGCVYTGLLLPLMLTNYSNICKRYARNYNLWRSLQFESLRVFWLL